jgi:hypothetical protein
MGHRTLSLGLVFRALFLDSEAFDELRDDDDPLVEGLFLLVLIGLITAALNFVGQTLAWGSLPRVEAVRDVVLNALQQQPWWSMLSANPDALATFQRIWDLSWRFFPPLFGAPDPAFGAVNLLLWPLWLVLSWLVYGLLAHAFARLLGGRGWLRGTLGTVALSFTPFLIRGLGILPFVVFGGVLNTWQLILRYKALRSAHELSWGRALAATLLPFLAYLLFWLVVGGLLAVVLALAVGGTR